MKTASSRIQYQEHQISEIIDALVFGYLQRKQYAKTLQTLLSESPSLVRDATTVPDTPHQIFVNVNCFLHDKTLEEIVETFYTYGRFDVSPSLIELGKKLRDLSNEFSTELSFGCHAYSGNEQRLYGRKIRVRSQNNSNFMGDTMMHSAGLQGRPQSTYCAPSHAATDVLQLQPMQQQQLQPMQQQQLQPMQQQLQLMSMMDSTTAHSSTLQAHYVPPPDANEEGADDTSANSSVHLSKRKAAHPLKRSKRVAEQIATILNERRVEREIDQNLATWMEDPLLLVDNMEDVLKDIVDSEDTLFQTLENEEHEEAMEAEQISHEGPSDAAAASLSLDIPLHEETLGAPCSSSVFGLTASLQPAPLLSPIPPLRQQLQPPSRPNPAATACGGTSRWMANRPAAVDVSTHAQVRTSTPKEGMKESLGDKHAAPLPSCLLNLPPSTDVHQKMEGAEKRTYKTMVEMSREASSSSTSRNGSESSPRGNRCRQPMLPPTPIPISTLVTAPSHPSTQQQQQPSTLPMPSINVPKLSSLGRIPKKGPTGAAAASSAAALAAASLSPATAVPSPSSSPRPPALQQQQLSPRMIDIHRGVTSKSKQAAIVGETRRDSMDSQENARAESMGESDCAMTEGEESVDTTIRKDNTATSVPSQKVEAKASWDDLFEDAPLTVEEANREKKRHKEMMENKRRMEMREMEKRKEREKRRKEKEKKEEDRKEKNAREEKEKRWAEERRRESIAREEKEEKEREERERRAEKVKRDQEEQRRMAEQKRREQEEQRRIIEAAKRKTEMEERARLKKKEEEERRKEEERRREKEREEQRRREKEKEEEKKREEKKKVEDERMKREREMKMKEERKMEMERRRRKDLPSTSKKIDKTTNLIGISPLDKIAAEMDGRELRNENDYEVAARCSSSRILEISSGMDRNRGVFLLGSTHSSKSGMIFSVAQGRRNTAERSCALDRQPRRPVRVQMAPMKRPPTASKTSSDDEDDDEEDVGGGDRRLQQQPPLMKRGKLEVTKIDDILNRLHR